MSFFTARNEKLAEPLLEVVLDSDVVLVLDDDDDDDDCTPGGGGSGQDCKNDSFSCTPMKREASTAGCCSNNKNSRRAVSESSSTSCCFLSYYLHSKFIFAGFLFGALMELAYVLANSLEEANDATTTTTSMTTTNSKKPNPIRAENWQDVFFFQLCFLFSYVMLVVYMFVLARRRNGSVLLKKNDKELTTLSLQIMAVNWTVGIVLGLAITVSFLFGPQVFLMRQQEHNDQSCQVLVIMIIGIALCLVAYGTVKDMQIYFRGAPPPPPGACCDRKTNNNDKTEQEARLDVNEEEDPSWIEARIV